MKHLSALLLLALPFAAQAEIIEDREFTRTIDGVGKNVIIEVDNIAGSINIVGKKGNTVRVEASLEDNVKGVEIVSDDRSLLIKVLQKDKKSRSWGGGEADLEITVPIDNEIDIAGVSAEIEVENVRGEQRLKAVSGDITTDAYDANISAGSVSGSVNIEGHNSKMEEVDFSSVSGDVYGTNLSGEISATSVSGDVELRKSRVTRGKFSSTSGDIDVETTLTDGSRLDFETVSGDVQLSLEGKIEGSFDFSTFSGDIDSCFGPKPTKKRDRHERLRFNEGNERYSRVDVTTLSGDIEVCD